MVNKYSTICLPLAFIISFIHAEKIQFDGEGCDKLNLVLANHECPSVGLYRTPGDCTVFFKCMKDNGKIKPNLEFCGMGYIFNETECQLNSNKTDCPQYHCVVSSTLGSASFLTSNEKPVPTSNKLQQPTYRPIVVPYGNATSTTESESHSPTEEMPENSLEKDFEMQTQLSTYKSGAIVISDLRILIWHCFTFVIFYCIRCM